MKLSVNKHLKYYGLQVKVTLMQMAEYRADMFSTILASYGYSLMTMMFIDVLFRNINSLAGWSVQEMYILFAVSQLHFYAYWVFFSSIKNLSDIIFTGKLDSYLSKPMSAYFKTTTENFNLIDMLPSLLIPIGILYFNWQAILVSWTNFITFIVTFMIGLAIYLLSLQSLALLSFWLTDTNELINLYDGLDFVHYPAEIYPKHVRPIFLTIIPLALFAYVPTVFLIRGFRWDLMAYQLGALVFFVVLVRVLWVKGLRNYSSASS